MTATAEIPKRLSVLDDEDDVVAGLERRLSKRGYDVERVVPPSASLEDTVAEIMRVSDAALCDHYLRSGHQVNFSGAQIVAALTERHFPSVLFTGVLPAELYAIRRNMSQIPAFLRRDEGGLGNERVLNALRQSVAEVRDGRRAPSRRGRRTPVTVVDSLVSGSEHLVEVLVAGWGPGDPIAIPADLLPKPWSSSPHEAVGRTFFANVNIAEQDADQLFFEEFESDPAETDVLLGNPTD